MTLLLVLIAVVPLLVAWRLAVAPVSASRIARFERRHHSAAEARPAIAGYLAHTRRWRATGVAGGHLAGLAVALPEQRVTASFTAMAAGWLAGAVLAEFRLPAAGGGDLPGWMRRVPVVLAVAAGACTVLLLPLARPADRSAVVAWGAGALACAAAMVVALRHIGHGGWAGSDRTHPASVDAMARHSADAIVGVGTALALACLGSQLTGVSSSYFDATRAAVALVGTLLALGGVVLGWRLAHATRSPLRSVTAFAVVFVLLAAATIGWARWQDQSPYPASALQATATIRFTDRARFDGDLRALGVSAALVYDESYGQVFVGRVDFRPPPDPEAEGDYHLVVIDKRQNRIPPQIFGGEGSGYSSTLAALPQRYPWLSAMADREGER